MVVNAIKMIHRNNKFYVIFCSDSCLFLEFVCIMIYFFIVNDQVLRKLNIFWAWYSHSQFGFMSLF